MSDLPFRPTTPEQWYDAVPRSINRQATFGLVLMLVAFGGFGLWAFLAPLAAAVISQGSFVATGENKIVQHLEGGIIKDILAKEGQLVTAGQVILRLDETVAQASRRELFLRRIRLEATVARLMSQHLGRERLDFPTDLLAAQADPQVAAILDSQRLSFDVAKSGQANDITLILRNIDATDMRTQGYQTQLAAVRGQLEILTEELQIKDTLLKDKLILRGDVSDLRRAKLDAEGQVGRIVGELNETAEMRRKFLTQIDKIRDEYNRAALTELQAIQGELESVREQARKAESVLIRTDVVAPVSGTVVRLFYHTSGGVIETGKPIAEILPLDAPLIIEVLIPRTDIDSVRVGQKATVRLTALNQRTTPVLNGEVHYVSADSVTDTSLGSVREVYVARVTLQSRELGRVHGFSPTPGMPVEIMIQTAERTFANYIAKPILDSMSRAFREQ